MSKHSKKTSKLKVFLNILIIIFLVGLVISMLYILKWLSDTAENKKLKKKVSEIISAENEGNENIEYKIDFDKFKRINNQTVAWLKVNGTNIEYLIVQAENNNYYLNKNLNKQNNVAGWIFADYKNKLDGTDKNIIIYGHNMKDNSMFGSLKNILTEEWNSNKENYTIYFITEKGQQKYKVFSVYKIKNEDYYIKTNFERDEFEKFIRVLQDRSIKNFNVEVLPEDSILTLSTCADDNKYRIVLHAKRISE